MHFLTPLLTTLALASTSTQALKLPEGYSIIEVIPIDPEDMYKEAKGNPHVPLINATIRCGRNYNVFWEGYELEGYGWDGVSEKQLKNAAKQGGKMTFWEFESWKENSCDPREHVPYDLSQCPKRPAGWRAEFVKPALFGRPERMLEAFEKLTGMYGKNYAAVEYLMSNGTNLISSHTWEDFPEEKKLFNC